jgi:xylulokinase
MSRWLGLDVGTSAVKAVLVDDEGMLVAKSSAPLEVSRPRSGWSEQPPDHWWEAANGAVLALPPRDRAGVRGIGLSGQMHGAVLLDGRDRPLRPAILWNDGRAAAECAELEAAEPRTRAITGNAAMPGFTAPKLLWVRRHEPEIFRAVAKVLLPKDYVRLCMTGEHASDVSDSAGTLWLDSAARAWSHAMLDACSLTESHVPHVFEGNEPTGLLRAETAATWRMQRVPVAAGGGDNAAGAVGAGVVEPGRAFLSLGTSGVLFVVTDRFAPAPAHGVHAFCHALPGRWHQMAVHLSAASALEWAARFGGHADVPSALAAAQARTPFAGPEVFLPYLSGERTPHADADARGALVGLDLDSDGAALVMAALEGVAFAFADGLHALATAGTSIGEIAVIGGGSRSALWGRILAAALDRTLVYRADAHVGPAFGAARLARLAVTGEDESALCTPPALDRTIAPEPALAAAAAAKRERFRALYPALKGRFR